MTRAVGAVWRSALIGLAVVMAVSGASWATPYVDQNNSVLPTGNFVAIRSGTTAAQTFTVGFSGTLTETRVVVDPRGTPVQNLTLEIQATTSGVANGTVLASASVAPFGGSNPTVVFDVSAANLSVTAGQVLAYVLSSSATLGDDYIARAVPGNKYAPGQFTDSGGAFASGAGWDGIFKTLVEPASLPGAGTTDQSNPQTLTGNFAAILSGLTVAQTFTVGAAGTLTRIDVVVDPRNTPVLDLYLEVQATTAGVPNGTLLAAASVAPFGGTNPTVTFDVGPYNLAVTQGQVLAFVLRSNAAGGTDYLLRAVPGNTYGGGECTNSSGGFASGAGWDAIFETFVYNAATGVDPVAGAAPASRIESVRSFPNPVIGEATIDFRLPVSGPVTLGIYDVSGRLVATLVDGHLGEGAHQARWNRISERGDRVGPGVYLYRLVAGRESRSARIVVIE